MLSNSKNNSHKGFYPGSGISPGGQMGRMSMVTKPGGVRTATNAKGSQPRPLGGKGHELTGNPVPQAPLNTAPQHPVLGSKGFELNSATNQGQPHPGTAPSGFYLDPNSPTGWSFQNVQGHTAVAHAPHQQNVVLPHGPGGDIPGPQQPGMHHPMPPAFHLATRPTAGPLDPGYGKPFHPAIHPR